MQLTALYRNFSWRFRSLYIINQHSRKNVASIIHTKLTPFLFDFIHTWYSSFFFRTFVFQLFTCFIEPFHDKDKMKEIPPFRDKRRPSRIFLHLKNNPEIFFLEERFKSKFEAIAIGHPLWWRRARQFFPSPAANTAVKTDKLYLKRWSKTEWFWHTNEVLSCSVKV